MWFSDLFTKLIDDSRCMLVCAAVATLLYGSFGYLVSSIAAYLMRSGIQTIFTGLVPVFMRQYFVVVNCSLISVYYLR